MRRNTGTLIGSYQRSIGFLDPIIFTSQRVGGKKHPLKMGFSRDFIL